mgnify:CR=1 FL=1
MISGHAKGQTIEMVVLNLSLDGRLGYNLYVMCFLLLYVYQSVMSVAAKQREDYYFIVHDAGESLMLQPVIDRFVKNDSVSFTILSLGEPSTSIFEDYAEAVTLSNYGIEIEIIDGYSRDQLLSLADLGTLLKQIDAPRVVVEGMAYAMQAQIGIAIGRAYDSHTVGVYDSFALWDSDSVASNDFVEQDAVQDVYVVAKEQQREVSRIAVSSGVEDIQVSVTGNPTINTWEAASRDTERVKAVRETLYPNITADTVAIVYAGGYGEEAYEASLKAFCTTATEAGEGFAFSFSPHPGYDPSYEEGLFASWGCADRVIIVWDSLHMDTAHIVAASNTSLSQCSTVGGQSLAIGVPHAYVSPEGSCVDVFTSAKLIPTTPTAHELEETLMKDFADENYSVPKYDILRAGIPLDATHRIYSRLLELIEI